jgi:hypothetical protein
MGVTRDGLRCAMFRHAFPLWLICSCTPPDAPRAPLELSPTEGSSYGYYDLRIDTALTVDEVWVGDNRGYNLRPDADGLLFTIHGHPTPGEVDVSLVTPDSTETYNKAFTFHPPVAGFETVVAIGASLAQGVQGGVPTQHGQLHSPSAFVAMAAGAYHPPPLLIPDLFPTITGADIGPPPECDSPNVVDFITSAAVEVLVKMNDVELDRIGFYLGLEDPDVTPHNLAVGGSGVGTLIYGPDPARFEQLFLARFVFDPYGDIADPIPTTALAAAEDMNPTVILCADTYGNDLLSWRPLEEVRDDMIILIDRLGATDAQVFLSNIPRLTLLPGAGANAERDALADTYREALDDEAARHDNVHVVDMYAAVEADIESGLMAGDHHLSMAAYDGLLSSDGLHLSDVGYAYQANLFIDSINTAMGTDLAKVDLGVVYETDNHSPDSLLEQGIAPACLQP